MKSILIWSGVGILVAGGAFLMFSFAPPQNPNQNPSSLSPLSVPVSEVDHSKGNPESQIALVEYGDFQCPACGAYFPILKQVEQEFGDRIAFVYRHFPLRQIHANAENAARASEAAALQGEFWGMHDMLFEKQGEWSSKGNVKDLFLDYAVSLGLNKEQFLVDIDSSVVEDHVQKDLDDAVRDGLDSTPSFFLAGTRLAPNPQSYEEFRTAILRALGS